MSFRNRDDNNLGQTAAEIANESSEPSASRPRNTVEERNSEENRANERDRDCALPRIREDGTIAYLRLGGMTTSPEFQLAAAREAEVILAGQVRAAHAAQAGEFFIRGESGDEWFDVTRADGHHRSGELG